jgi:hypothetical protein
LEGLPTVEHGYEAGFAVIAIPSAKARANPGGVSEGAFWARILLFERFAFELSVKRFD